MKDPLITGARLPSKPCAVLIGGYIPVTSVYSFIHRSGRPLASKPLKSCRNQMRNLLLLRAAQLNEAAWLLSATCCPPRAASLVPLHIFAGGELPRAAQRLHARLPLAAPTYLRFCGLYPRCFQRITYVV